MIQKKYLLFTWVVSGIIALGSAFLTDALLEQSYLWYSIGLQRSYNSGIAFGIQLGSYQVAIITAALVIITVTALKATHTMLEQIGYGLLLGGAYANMIDRLIDTMVTDMIRIGSFPIFNIADAFINIGVALLIIQLLYEKRIHK